MKTKKTVTSDKWRATKTALRGTSLATHHSSLITRSAFTLIEVMVVVVLLALIVIVLMGVFSSTQAAFRAGVTQEDFQEGGRAAMDLMAGDLKEMAPSLGTNNGAVNFCVTNYGYAPLNQPLVASASSRANVQENFFILGRGSKNGVPTWFATGYAVYLSPTNLYSLYRFSKDRPVAAGTPGNLFYTDFLNFLAAPNNYSHLIDGVVGLRLRTFDAGGALITNNFPASIMRTNSLLNLPGEPGYLFYSNAVPASVEVEMATLEDRTLQRAESLPDNLPAPPPNDRRTLYLQGQSGKVHVFRQRVSVPNVDLSAYK